MYSPRDLTMAAWVEPHSDLWRSGCGVTRSRVPNPGCWPH